MINSYLTGEAQQEDHVIHLLFSANRWEAAYVFSIDVLSMPQLMECRAQIKADVAAGTTVVVDRYCYSGCVYSAAKNVPGLDLVWARWPDVGLPRPDLCIFLDISPQDAASRGGYGQERYEREAMQLRVRQLFQELRTIYDRDDFHVIDGGRPLEEVEKAVLEAVLAKLDGHGHGGLTEELRSVQPVASPAAEPSRASK